MKKVYNSLEELLSSCTTSSLKSGVSSVLRNDEHVKWNFVSASMDGDVYRSEFTAPVEGTDLVRRLFCEITPERERQYSFISGFAPTRAWVNF